MTKTEEADHEDTTIGGVTWHSSDVDGGPDCGISVYLGPNDRLYCGEISDSLLRECTSDEFFESSGGWFIVRFAEQTTLIAKCADRDAARDFIELFAAAIRSRNEG